MDNQGYDCPRLATFCFRSWSRSLLCSARVLVVVRLFSSSFPAVATVLPQMTPNMVYFATLSTTLHDGR